MRTLKNNPKSNKKVCAHDLRVNDNADLPYEYNDDGSIVVNIVCVKCQKRGAVSIEPDKVVLDSE